MKISIGCDLVYITRFKKSLESRRFIERVFHKIEQEYCDSKKNKAASYAARFAAKEALAKALGTGLFSQNVAPNDIWIEHDIHKKPILCVSQKLKKILNQKKITHWDVSLSHHGNYAMATVVMHGKNQ